MKEDYVGYELALKLKACGFDEPCRAHYTNDYINDDPEDISREVKFHYDWTSPYNYNRVVGNTSAPTLAHAQKWLREKKGIAINVIAHDGGAYDYDIVFLPNAVDCDCPIDRATFSRTYEEALSEGIISVLDLIKKARNLFRRNSDFFEKKWSKIWIFNKC